MKELIKCYFCKDGKGNILFKLNETDCEYTIISYYFKIIHLFYN